MAAINISAKPSGSAKNRKFPFRNRGGKVSSEVKSYVKQQLANDANHKFVITDIGNAALNSTAVIIPLTLVAQGDDVINREGDEIKAKSLEIRYTVQNSVTPTQNTVRIIVFRDNQANGVVPTAAEVLELPAVSLYSPATFVNRGRFTFIYDRTMMLDYDINTTVTPATGVTAVALPKQYHEVKRIPLGGYIKYLGTTAAQASCGKGTLYLLSVTNTAANNGTLVGRTMVLFDE